ncbi:MAG: polysaccharide deacetylase family protein [Gemmatimonadetes bacterium]|nr:polysaccharide deacetylase family protein [Gemmatimonadota bacterium]
MTAICLYAQVHQPFRLRPYGLFDIGTGAEYFDTEQNRALLRRVAEKCYLPANRLLADQIRRSQGEFRLALSLSGTFLDQLAAWAPEVLQSFQELVATGGVELLGETYHHSLASLASEAEFVAQVERHRAAIGRHFGQRPVVFRNTELIYWDNLAPLIARLGFRGVMVEGADHVLDWRSANHVYAATTAPGLRLLPRHYRLSDDIGFRFSNRAWDGWPLTAEKHADWIAASGGDSVHLYVDYETFGEHQWADTGIFAFLAQWPRECLRRGLTFAHPGTLAARAPVAPLAFTRPTSWADVERDTTAWLGNRLQEAAQQRIYGMREAVLAARDPALLERWRRLTTSDHLYYMCTKWFADGDVHKYFSPYESPYDAFVACMNVLQDLEQSLPVPMVEAAPPALAARRMLAARRAAMV